VLAARRAGIPAIDQAVIDPTDEARLTREVAEAVNLGFAGKVCIHPRQVPAVHAGFRPALDEIERAHRIVAAHDTSVHAGQGVSMVDGTMIDRPTLHRALAVLAHAEGDPPAVHLRADRRGLARQRPTCPVAGRYFDQLTVGEVIHHAVTRTITEADNTLFSCVTMNPQPLHLDEAYSAATKFGTRIVNSMFTLSVVVGLSVYELTLGTVVANLGFSSVETPHPVFPATPSASRPKSARRARRDRDPPPGSWSSSTAATTSTKLSSSGAAVTHF